MPFELTAGSRRAPSAEVRLIRTSELPRACDVVVSGGGPGGLMTAIRALRHRQDVVVLEKRSNDFDATTAQNPYASRKRTVILTEASVTELHKNGVDVGTPLKRFYFHMGNQTRDFPNGGAIKSF